MTRIISVTPAAFGWSLRIDAQDSVLVFASGAQAEDAARRLACRLADAGEPAEILIRLRDGSLAGRLVTTPPETASATA
jgi:ApbE superfamily uncharacterized protein (UPF0280 family)